MEPKTEKELKPKKNYR